MTTSNIEKTVQRLIDQEILTGCNEFVQYMTEGLNYNSASLGEVEPQLFSQEDYSDAPGGYTIERSSSDAEIENGDSPAFYWSRITDEDVQETSEDVYDTGEEAIKAAFEDAGDEPPFQESLQYWIVTDWLAEKLESVGAMVAHDVLGFAIWGRSERGQSLTMDSDLNKVAKLLEDN